jgi:hypothetical protein
MAMTKGTLLLEKIIKKTGITYETTTIKNHGPYNPDNMAMEKYKRNCFLSNITKWTIFVILTNKSNIKKSISGL